MMSKRYFFIQRILPLFFLAAIFNKAALAQTFDWAGKFDDATELYSRDIAVDHWGNTYTVGYFDGTADFDPGSSTYNLTSAGWDGFLTKLDAAGHFVWAIPLGGPDLDYAQAVDVDAAGNVYVTGLFGFTMDFDPGPGVFNITATGANYESYIFKLDAAGNLLWAKSFDGTSSNDPRDIAVNPAGEVFGTGFFSDTVDFDPGPAVYELSASSPAGALYIYRLDTDGNFVWAGALENGNSIFTYCIGLDQDDNVLLGGHFDSTVDFDPGAGSAPLTATGAVDAFILKMDASGNYIWVRQIEGTGHQLAWSISTDAAGNVYTAGLYETGTDFDPGAGTFSLPALGTQDIYIMKMDAAGNFIWAKVMGSTYSDHVGSIDTDDEGNVYINGAFFDIMDCDPGPGVFNLSAGGNMEAMLVKLNTNGNFVWALQFNGFPAVAGYALTLDQFRNIYTTGALFFGGPMDFDHGAGVFELTTNTLAAYVHKIQQCSASNNTVTITGCEAMTSPSGLYTWTTSGTYIDTVPNSASCDSVITIHLTVGNSYTDQTIEACESYTSPSGTYTWAVSGTYTDTLPKTSGCDSVITIHLTIGNSHSGQTTEACDSYTSPSGSYTWITSGVYTDTVSTAAGCDSVITFNLTIYPSPMVNINFSSGVLCVNDLPVNLTGGAPAGGTWSGPGVSGSTFDPGIAGAGTHELVYTFTSAGGCTGSDSTAIVVDFCTGIAFTTSDVPAFKIMPNPGNGVFRIESATGIKSSFVIYNSMGSLVGHAGTGMENDWRHLPAGIYFLQAYGKTGPPLKLVKQ